MSAKRFGTVPPEPPREFSLVHVAPKLRVAVERTIAEMRLLGEDPLVFETLRTAERQAWLHGFGRLYDDTRGIVTWTLEADDGWHFYGLAVDIICARRMWNAPWRFWDRLRRIGRKHNLRSGADWNHNDRTDDERKTDWPHLQWGPPMRVSPTPTAARLLASGGREAVWKEVGAL